MKIYSKLEMAKAVTKHGHTISTIQLKGYPKTQPNHKNETPFCKEELTTSIKKLKRKKSTGPDLMPNEIFIEADEKTKEIYLYTLNQI